MVDEHHGRLLMWWTAGDICKASSANQENWRRWFDRSASTTTGSFGEEEDTAIAGVGDGEFGAANRPRTWFGV